jgi:hypothetical protein
MKTLVLFLIVWVWIACAIGSYGLTVGYFDGVSTETEVPFDCLKTGAVLLVGTCLFGGPVVLLVASWMTQGGRYGLVWRWKNA